MSTAEMPRLSKKKSDGAPRVPLPLVDATVSEKGGQKGRRAKGIEPTPDIVGPGVGVLAVTDGNTHLPAEIDDADLPDLQRFIDKVVDWTMRGRMKRIDTAKVLKNLALDPSQLDEWGRKYGQGFAVWCRQAFRAGMNGFDSVLLEARAEKVQIRAALGEATPEERKGFSDRRQLLRKLNPEAYAGTGARAKSGTAPTTINIDKLLVNLDPSQRDALDAALQDEG